MGTDRATTTAKAADLPRDIPPTARLYLRPVGLKTGMAEDALPLYLRDTVVKKPALRTANSAPC